MDRINQKVILAIRTIKGSIPGYESFGSDFSSIKFKDENFTTKIRNTISLALKDLIDLEEISLESVEVSDDRATQIQIVYKNLTTLQTQTINI